MNVRLRRWLAAVGIGFALAIAPGPSSMIRPAPAILLVACWDMASGSPPALWPGDASTQGLVCQDADGDLWWID